jgi:osmoprotectant transport system permease protein
VTGRLLRLFLAAWLLASCIGVHGAERVVVGSKRFTESYILGDIVAQTAAQSGAEAVHRPGLGSTAVVLQALKAGAIDVYPEYLGTIEQEILKLPPGSSPQAVQQRLAAMGLAYGVPLGFSDGYGLAVTAAKAQALSLHAISDLRAHPALRVAVSQEFLGRADGWPGLAARYALPQRPTGIDHGLAYAALAGDRIDLTDIYTTDARIAQLGLVVLRDDAGYFPRYDAVLLYRADLPRRAPQAWQRIVGLAGQISTARMIEMNAAAELRARPFAAIAADFVEQRSHRSRAATALRASNGFRARLFGPDLARLTREHVSLVAAALAIAVLLGVPLGAVAAARKRLGHAILAATGLLQTVPSLALLAALIPLLGRIGTVPAVAALSLYALLPIVRNTATGLEQVPPGLKQAGTALGMTRLQRWWLVDLPLAFPVLLAGIKTAAVLTVGTATIAAFIGAGGYGERIVQGLALNDSDELLAGAIPSAALAVLTQGLFELVERWLHGTPRGGSEPR